MKTRMSSLILLAPMLALFIARSCLATTAVQFAAATNCNVGVNPVSIAIADFNRDGHLDIATANDSTGNLTILLGDGQGGFTVKTNYPIGTVPQGVAAGDFDGDGIPDLVATRGYGGQAIILRGLGDGNFAPATYQSLGITEAAGTILVGDFNNDNKLDFIAALNPIGFSVSLGNGNGTFATANTKTFASDATIAIGDFNNDGKLDVAVPYQSGKYISIFLGNGDGTFGTATNYSLVSMPQTGLSGVVAVADLNRDGKLDLVVAEQTSTNSLGILLGDGHGGFTTKTNYALGAGATTIAIGDLNGDGIPDLVVGTAGSKNVMVMLGNGDGTFGSPVSFPVANYVEAVAIADINGDGQPDIVTANEYGTVSVLLNQTLPPLSISTAGNQIVLAWPTYATGFQPKTTTNCAAANSWGSVSGTPTVVGNQYLLTNQVDSIVRFYRLQK